MTLRIAGVIISILLALLAAPFPSYAQQPGKVYRIGALGYVSPTSPVFDRDWVRGFKAGLRERGYIEGQHYLLDYRWTKTPWEEAPALAAELVRRKVDLLLVVGITGTRAAKEATSSIPIVTVYVVDPVRAGLVASLAHPGGNVTGVAFSAGPEIAGKCVQLLREAVPTLSRVAVLSDSEVAADSLREAEGAARALGLTLQPYEVREPKDFERAFTTMTKARAEALLVLAALPNFSHARRIAEFAAKNRLPAVYPFRESVEAGGLMAYAANSPAMFHRAAGYVDKILKGAKPADLPVEQPTKFDLIINLKTAKALGLTIPQSLLMRADEVIQ